MKRKKIALLAGLLVTTAVLSCIFAGKTRQPELSHESCGKVVAEQGGKYYDLYELVIYTYGYIEEEDTFASGSGQRLHNILPEEAESFPVIKWEDDFSLIVPENLKLDKIDILRKDGEPAVRILSESVYKDETEFQEEGLQEYQKYFAELPQGTYYVGAEVHCQGKYIEEKGEYEYSGMQYIFCLEK